MKSQNARACVFAVATIMMCCIAVEAQDPEVIARDRDFVMVCEDAGAGAYEAFPDVCRLQDGRLMAIFYAGWEHVSMPDAERPLGGRISMCFSSDEGRTWTAAQTLFDGPDDDRDPSVVQLPDGRILVSFFMLRNHGEGYRGMGSWVVESKDSGVTWSAPRLISTYYCSSPIRVLSTGRLILGVYQELTGNAWGATIHSDDLGQTWSLVSDVPSEGVRLDAETDIIELKDGRLLAALRADKAPMHYAISTDKGTTWEKAISFGFPGHCPYFHRAPDGTILLAHRLPATSLHFTADDGATWSDNVSVDAVGGAYPSMVTLKDDSVLVVYYEEGEGSSIRARKCRTSAAGIEWLRWDE